MKKYALELVYLNKTYNVHYQIIIISYLNEKDIAMAYYQKIVFSTVDNYYGNARNFGSGSLYSLH
jgi:hypothetical protein